MSCPYQLGIYFTSDTIVALNLVKVAGFQIDSFRFPICFWFCENYCHFHLFHSHRHD